MSDDDYGGNGATNPLRRRGDRSRTVRVANDIRLIVWSRVFSIIGGAGGLIGVPVIGWLVMTTIDHSAKIEATMHDMAAVNERVSEQARRVDVIEFRFNDLVDSRGRGGVMEAPIAPNRGAPR